MMEFGNTLRAAREAKGYTVVQLADITHLAPATITDLEEENFSHIAAPIYGRGFVKLYCAAVGLDPQPMVLEFTELFEGNRDISIRERPPRAAAPITDEPPREAPPPPLPAQPDQPDPVPRQTTYENQSLPFDEPAAPVEPREDVFPQTTIPEPASAAEDVAPQFAQPAADTVPEESDISAPPPRLSRYSMPLRNPVHVRLPPNTWRLVVLGLSALAILTLVFFTLRAIGRALSSTPEQPAEPALSVPAEPEKPAPAASQQPRTPVRIPDLYID